MSEENFHLFEVVTSFFSFHIYTLFENSFLKGEQAKTFVLPSKPGVKVEELAFRDHFALQIFDELFSGKALNSKEDE